MEVIKTNQTAEVMLEVVEMVAVAKACMKAS
jgi:hypothetical protein